MPLLRETLPDFNAGLQICRGFKVHDLITCESKVQGHDVVALGPWALEKLPELQLTNQNK